MMVVVKGGTQKERQKERETERETERKRDRQEEWLITAPLCATQDYISRDHTKLSHMTYHELGDFRYFVANVAILLDLLPDGYFVLLR